MSASRPPDTWASGDAYEPFVGRWSRLVAAELLRWFAVPAGARWLDVGCGTGALSAAIVRGCDPADVLGVDPSQGFVEHARAHVPGARFAVGDAGDLPAPDAGFDASVSGLVLNFVPDPARAVAEMARVVRPGGVVAVYVWDYAGDMQMLRRFWDAAAALDPGAAELDEARRFPTAQPDALDELFRGAGLAAVQGREIVVPTVFSDFDDYWSPFLGGQGPAPSYLEVLDEDAQAALRERLRATLPAGDDGSIALTARAWAVRGLT